MNSDMSGVIAMLDAQRRVRRLVEFRDSGDDRPSRIRQVVIALGSRFAAIVAQARDETKRGEVAQAPVASGD